MKLRDYQQKAVKSLFKHFKERKDNPCVVIPTGGGKTIVIAEFIRRCIKLIPDARFCVVAHTAELVFQNGDKLHKLDDSIDIGYYCASLNKKDLGHKVIFASIQSIYNKTYRGGIGKFDVILVDEAHHIPFEGDGQYITFIKEQKAINPYLKVCGLTATPYRTKGGPICDEDKILNHISFEAKIKPLIAKGYLTPPMNVEAENFIDVTDIKIKNGEFDLNALDDRVCANDIVPETVKEIKRIIDEHNLKKTIIFATSVKHANLISGYIMEKFMTPCPVIEANTPKSERSEFIKLFNEGKFKYIVNMGVLTEGFDCPDIDCVAIVRPTKSMGLYYQMVGRGLRLAPNKDKVVIIDFGQNIDRHGPIDQLRGKKQFGGKPDNMATEKFCPQCDDQKQNPLALAAQRCPVCDYEFFKKGMLVAETNAGYILSGDGTWEQVQGVTYHIHESRNSGLKTMRVRYNCWPKSYNEYICLDHTGFAYKNALKWCFSRFNGEPHEWREILDEMEKQESQVDYFITQLSFGLIELKEPTEVLVKQEGKYLKVSDYKW